MSIGAPAVREPLIQAIRSWIIGVTGIAPEKCLVGNPKVRPAMPYVTVTVLAPSIPVGMGERVYVSDGDPPVCKRGMRQHFRATLQVASFGDDASDLLLALIMAIDDPRSQALLAGTGFSVTRTITPIDSQVWIDTDWEARSNMDIEVSYKTITTPSEFIVVDSISHELTLPRYTTDTAPLMESGVVEVPED